MFEIITDSLDGVDGPDDVRFVAYGVSGNVCLRFAVEGLLDRGYNVTVVEDAVASLPAEGGLQSWDDLLDNWQDMADKNDVDFNVTDTDSVVERLS